VTDHPQRDTAAEIVAALGSIAGVVEASVEPDGRPHGAGSLRLQLRPDADERSIATAVDGLLRRRFGLAVDADDLPRERTDPAALRRLALQRVQVASSGPDVTAVITLGLDGREFVGEAAGLATDTGMQRVVASATLRAVEAAAAGQLRFELDHVDLTPTTGHGRAALVVVTLLNTRGDSERLSGASVVRDDVRQAVIRATLAAVNRRVAPVLEGV
jgi:hypothetical protein